MSAEFPACRAREITDNSDGLNCEKWYAKFKDDLFQLITEAALRGHDHLSIHSVHWENNDIKANYLKKVLFSLGYKTNIRNNSNYDIEMVISW